MITRGNRYYQQVQLLVRVLPYVAEEQCFALKGGTAINLFIRDLPRLSVDIDLAYLPVADYQHSRTEIDAALRRIRDRLTSGSPAYRVTAGANDAAGSIDTLNVTDGNETVKVEVNPVLRGSVNAPSLLSLRPSVQSEFGFAEITTLAFEDVYAGKLMAALDRQHPRDFFDVMVLFENEGISDGLFRTWLAYLVGHKGSMADSLSPHRKDIASLFRDQFLTMTEREVTLEQLLEVRERLIGQIRSRIGAQEKAFLLSVKRGEPQWGLLGSEGVERLPAVRWKLHNLAKMSPDAHNVAVARLERVLSEIE
jgi:predicted nucleotidyltransferase component of viral defense system